MSTARLLSAPLLALLAIATLANAPLQRPDGELDEKLSHTSERHVYEMQTRDDREEVELQLQAQIRSGHLDLRFVDPDGREIAALHSGSSAHLAVETGIVRLVAHAPASTGEARRGTWHVELGLRDATG